MPIHILRAAILIALSVFAVTSGCSREQDDGVTRVVVSIPPLRGLIEPMLPPDAELHVLVPPGASVHGYRLSPSDVARIAEADLVIYVGLGLESGLERHLDRKTAESVICMAELTPETAAAQAELHDHDHGHDHDHDHSHGAVDPHLWLDPGHASRLVDVAAERITELAGVSTDQPAADLQEQVEQVHQQYEARLAPFEGAAIVTHHASFGRVAERYGLRVAALLREVETSEPSPEQIATIRRAIESEGVRAVFIEPQFSSALAERLASEAGVVIGRLDPLGDGDWAAMMESNLAELERHLGGAP